MKLLYRELEDDSGVEGDGAADAGDESWNDQFYRHVDVVAADRVFTDNIILDDVKFEELSSNIFE